ncbi:MAG: transketolase family protein [Clostridia bacterium]|nr:transketolase family protein [Clostridia bacterium]
MADVIKTATRDAYGKALVELGATNDKIVVLDADLAAATKTGMFKKAYPERFIDSGIAESNMMGVAAGLASVGYTVFASTFAMFASGRAFEQVRNSIAYPNLNVKVCATHAGISVGEDGASHQCCEDMGLMRTIPGMTIINPADAVEARAAVIAAADYKGPVYMRFGRLAVPCVFDDSYEFKWGKAVTLCEGKDITICASGLMVNEAVEARKILAADGIDAEIVNVHTVKPLDTETICRSAAKTGCVVTAEEHNIIGGLGSAVCEAICESGTLVPVCRVGVEDKFGKSGPAVELLHIFGLDAANIAAKAKQAVAMKK